MPLLVPADVDLSALGIYNVKEPAFGAVGNGLTDDTVAIQSAINAAYEAGGGIVYLPKSQYLIDGNMTIADRPSHPGGNDGNYRGTTSIPNIPHTPTPYPLTGITTNNNGDPGHVGHPTVLPNGPLLLFENVILCGDGPEQTILLAGENIYGGFMLAPAGTMNTDRQSGVVVATPNWWADYASDLNDFLDGFFAHNVYVRDLSIDCQGKLGVNHGLPGLVISNTTHQVIPNTQLQLAADGATPVGQLSGVALTLHAVQNCGVDNAWVYDGNVNGIIVDGTDNLDAHANGPLTQSYEQTTGTVLPLSNLEIFVPNIDPTKPFGTPSQTNVPSMHATVSNCRVDLNYPVWLAGTRSLDSMGHGDHGFTGGSAGQLPIRCVGAADVLVTRNRVGQRNQPSSFGAFTPPPGTTNLPDVPPNTNDAMDCPGCWHIIITNNILTNCGDGIGSAGNGDMVIANNVMYNFGAVGVDLTAPNNGVDDNPPTAKGPSQTIVTGNTFFLSGDSGTSQQAISYEDLTSTPSGGLFGSGLPVSVHGENEQATSQQGCLIIADNVFYASNISVFCGLNGWGIVVRGNIFDFAGNTPFGQPLATNAFMKPNDASFEWPVPSGTGINVVGNDIVIEGNLFRNAGPAGVGNTAVIGIHFPAGFPPPLVGTDSVRVLVKGNIFDKTIGVPIQNDSTDRSLGVPRILDNIGVNPVGHLDPTLVPIPSTNVPFVNPYTYDCYVSVTAGTGTCSVSLYGVTFASIAAAQQKAFLVKAGGSITLTYVGTTRPVWIWVGL